MNIRTTRLSIITIISLLVFTTTASLCSAQEWSRKGKSELFGTIQRMGGETIEYSFPIAQPVKIDMDSTNLYGIGYGYNFTDHWNINTDLLFGSADTEVKIVDTTVETPDMDYILWDLNLDYNIWKSRFTPLFSAGVGFMDVSIVTSTDAGKVQENNFSFNLGAGVRWDVKDNIFLKVVYRSIWTEVRDADNDQRFDRAGLSVAYMF
jgi:opacity protein-like surface antigen